jgi:hypothetical protein
MSSPVGCGRLRLSGDQLDVVGVTEEGSYVERQQPALPIRQHGGDDDFAFGLEVGLAVGGFPLFAVALGALKADALGDLAPVGRIEVLHVWVDGHCVSTFTAPSGAH